MRGGEGGGGGCGWGELGEGRRRTSRRIWKEAFVRGRSLLTCLQTDDGHWALARENIFQPNCQILSNNPGLSHSKFCMKSKSHKHILLRKTMWNEFCTCAKGPPATFQRVDQLSHILKPVQRLGPERWRRGGLKTLNLTCSKMHCCKSGTRAS